MIQSIKSLKTKIKRVPPWKSRELVRCTAFVVHPHFTTLAHKVQGGFMSIEYKGVRYSKLNKQNILILVMVLLFGIVPLLACLERKGVQ